jgi:hypothetical protein
MKKNKAKCRHCGDIIESKHPHDFVSCSCFKNEGNTTGIFVDGGNDYWRQGGNFENFERIDEDIKEK